MVKLVADAGYGAVGVRRAARGRVMRDALWTTTALVGVALASSAAAQTIATPTGGGTITRTGGSAPTVSDQSGANGGIQITNVTQATATTVNGVTISNTTGSPTANALDIRGSTAGLNSTGVTITGTNNLTTTVSGGAAYYQQTNANEGLAITSSGSTFTGSYGINLSAPAGFISFNAAGQSQNFVANGSAIAGINAISSINAQIEYGTSVTSGFATGVNASNFFGTFFHSTGGSIAATTTGIRLDATGGSSTVDSQTAITAPTGINSTNTNGATITTSGGGTINGTAAGTGTGILTSGGDATTITQGAAIGNTTAFNRGISATATGSGTVTVNSNAAIATIGNGARGILVTTAGGTSTVTTSAAITTADNGSAISINSGTGVSTVTVGGAITISGTNGTGIEAFQVGAASVVNVNANIIGGNRAISAKGTVNVATGVTLSNDIFGVDLSSTGTLNNAGSITSNYRGVVFNGTLNNLAGGTISSTGTAFANSAAVYIQSNGALNNAGTISVTNANVDGVFSQALSTITNTGSITGTRGIFHNSGSNVTVNNTGGTINGTVDAINVQGSGRLNLTNTGTIQTVGGTGGTGAGGVYIASANGTAHSITNSGTINGGSDATFGYGVDIDGGSLTLTNLSGGNIGGGTGAIRLSTTGAATADLQFGSTTGRIFSEDSGARTIIVGGALTGNYEGGTGTGAVAFTLGALASMQGATFGSGNDTFTFNGGTIGGVVNAGSGTDTFNSVLGAGNSAAVSLSNLTGFESYNHQSGILTLTGSTTNNASGTGAWNLSAGTTTNLSGSLTAPNQNSVLNVTATAPTTVNILSGGALSGFTGVFFNGPATTTFSNAGTLTAVSNGVFSSSGAINATNSGTITATNNEGISFAFGTSTLTNSGTITGGSSASQGYAASARFGSMTVTNQAGGFLTGGTGGLLVGNGTTNGGLLNLTNNSGAGITGPTAIMTAGTGALTLNNTGQVIGSTNAIKATGSGAVTITNNVGGVIATGTLASAGATYVAGGMTDAVLLSTSGATTINNSGMISGGLAGISQAPGATGALTVINRAGTINGAANDGITARGVFNAVNAQGATISSQVNSGIAVVGTSNFTNGGSLTGGTDATFGYGFQAASSSATTFNNFGSATGSQGGVVALGSGPLTVNLFAGSNTGNIVGGSGNDTLSLYNGTGTSNTGTSYVVASNTLAAGVPTDATRVLVQSAGTLAGATVGAIDLGDGTNTLVLRGTGDGTAANGAVGTLSNTIAGLSVLNKQDSGTWNITGGVNYSGDTNVQAGRLVFVNRTAPSGTTTISSGATLEFNLTGGNYFQDGATFNGAGTFAKTGTALLANRGLISLAAGGLIDVQGGSLVGSSDGQGTFTGNLASLNVATGATFFTSEAIVAVDGLTGTGTVATDISGNFTVGINNGSATFNGTIVDQNGNPGGKLVKVGTGTQTLVGHNTYTGGTQVLAGTLVAGTVLGSFASDSLGVGTVAISSGATVRFDNPYSTATPGPSAAQTYVSTNTFTGAGTLAFVGGAGSLTVLDRQSGAANVAMSVGGLIDVQTGSVLARGANVFAGNQASLNIASGAAFDAGTSIAIDGLSGGGSFVGNGTLTLGVANGSATFGGTLGNETGGAILSLTKTGTGTQTLSGVNTYTGATTISGGTLALTGTGSIANSASVTNNASFSIAGRTGGTSVNQLTGTGTVLLGANTLTANNAATGMISGVISGVGGGFTKSGAGNLTLSGANTYTGVTTISAGTLTGTTTSIVGSSIVDNATLAYLQAASGTVAQNITGSGVVTVSGLTAGNAITFNGALTNGGGLVLGTNGSATVNGSVANASANGAVQVTGTSGTLANNGTIQGTAGVGVRATTSATITNAANSFIVGTAGGILETAGTATITNSGTIGAGTLSGATFTPAIGSSSGINIVAGTITNNVGGLIRSGAGTNGYGVITSGTTSVTNNGTIIGAAFGVLVNTTTGTSTITNNGIITATNPTFADEYAAIYTRNAATIANYGSLTGIDGIRAGGLSTVDNYGSITATTSGNGIALAGGGIATNRSTGLITAIQDPGAWGIYATSLAGGTLSNLGIIRAGVGLVANGVSTTISNSGSIAAISAGIEAIGVALSATNSGTISATNTGALATVAGVRTNRGGSFINNGMITGVATGVLNSGGAITITNSGTISGSTAAITTSGNFADIVNLSAASTTSGGISLGDGADTLNLMTGASVTGVIDGGTGTDAFVATGTGSTTLAGNITNFENLTKNGTGTLTLSGANTGFATVAINAGTLNASGGAAINDTAAVTVAGGGAFGLLASETIGSLAGAGNVSLSSFTLTTGGDNSSTLFSGVASGTGGLTKVGTGTLTLSGANTFTGDVQVSAGTLAYGANDVLADTVTVTIDSGATFNLNGFSDTIGTLNLYGTLANGGLLTAGTYNAFAGSTIGQAISSGTLNVYGDTSLTAATAATPISIFAGALTTGSADLLSDTGAVLIGTGAQLTLGGAEAIGSLADLNGTSGVVERAGNVLTVGGANTDTTFSGAIQSSVATGGLTKVGTGTLTLTGINTGLGDIVTNAGILSVSSLDNLGDTGSIGLLGGTLATTGSFTTNRTLFTSSISGPGGIDVATGTTFTVAGLVSGDGALNKSGLGTLNLLGANSGFSGDLFVNGGAVRAGNTQAFGTGTIHLVDPTLIYGASGTYANNILLEVQSPASADPSTLRAEAGVFATISGSITQGMGTGIDPFQPLVIDGPGQIILTNTANSWAGTTTITAGSFLQGTTQTVSGQSLLVNGTLRYIQSASGTLNANASGAGNIIASGLAAGQVFTVASMLNMTNTGLTVSDASALSVTGAIRSTNGTALFLNNPGAMGTSVLTNAGTIAGLGGVFGGGQTAVTNLVGGSITSTTGNIIRLVGTGSSVTNAGSISGASNFSGIFFDGIGTITNQAGGTISNTATAVQFGGASGTLDNSGTISNTNTNSAVFFNGTGTVTNRASGTISSPSGFGVQLTGAAATVNNMGVISAGQRGVSLDGANAVLTNSGQISGGNAAVVAANAVVTNSGTLTGTGGSALALTGGGTVANQAGGTIMGASNGINVTAGSASVTNAGSITGSSGAGVRLSGGGSVTNAATGQITGTGNAAVIAQGAALMLTNQGSLTGTTGIAVLTTGAFNNLIDLQAGSTTNGSVTTDTGADTLTVAGMVSGAVGLGAGDDSFTLVNGGGVSGAIDGGTGTDSFIATGTGNTTLAGNITNFESLAQNGTGTLTLSGVNSGFATVAVNAGTLNVSGGAAIDDTATVTVASGATLGVLSNETVATLALNGTLAGTGTLTAATYSLIGATVNGNLGAGTLTQVGGTSTLNGTAAATTVNIDAGTLTLGASNRLADAAVVAVASGAALNLGAFDDTVGSLQLAGNLNGTGTLTAASYTLNGAIVNGNLGAGTLLQASGTSTLNGTSAAATVNVNGGTLTLGASNRLADAANVIVAPGAILDLAAFSDTVGLFALNGTLNGTGTLTAGQYQLTGATVNGNLGAGTLFQMGNSSVLNGTSAAAIVAIQSGTLSLGASERLANSATVLLNSGATFDLANKTETIGTLFNGANGGGIVATGTTGRLVAGGTNADFGFSGTFAGNGDVDKTGSGTFTYAPVAATTTARLNALGGTLLFAGTTGGAIRVAGGTLTGAGTVGGNLSLSSGTLSPGTAAQPIASFQAASLNISGGNVLFDVAGQAGNFASDLIRVTGAAVLTGGTASIRTTEPNTAFRVTQFYTVLQAGSLTGTFANGQTLAAVSNDPSLQFRLRYDLMPNSVLVELRKQIDFSSGLPIGTTPNELAVANALNGAAFTGSDGYIAALNTIAAGTPSQRTATFDSISGEALSDIATTSLVAATGFTDMLRIRIAGNVSASGDAGNLAAGRQNAFERISAARGAGSSALAGDGDRGASAWLAGYGQSGRLEGRNGAADVRQEYAGVALGAEGHFGSLQFGAAIAANRVDTRVVARNSHADGTLYQGGVYAAYDDGATYANLVGTYYSGDISTQRNVFVNETLFGTATGQTKTHGYTLGGSIGHRFQITGGYRITPQLSGGAARVERDAFTETGAGVLSLSSATDTRQLYQAAAELKLSHRSENATGWFEPYVSGGVRRNWGDRSATSGNRFVGAPLGTGAFTIGGAELPEWAGLLSAGFDAKVDRKTTLGIAFDSAIANRQKEGRVSINLKVGF